jgi:hypothetical protein
VWIGGEDRWGGSMVMRRGGDERGRSGGEDR